MDRFRAIMAAVEAGALQREHEPDKAKPRPFITISRQAGIDTESLLGKLIPRLRELDKGDPPWTGFDRKLVEKVAQDHQLHRPLVEGLEDSQRSILEDLFAGLNFESNPEPAEFVVYRRVAQTIRALSQVGRSVIVGRGGVFITKGVAGGLHLSLMAPFSDRVAWYSQSHGISEEQAKQEVSRIDRNRTSFYARYWPEQTIGPETFTCTLNVSAIEESSLVESIAALVPGLRVKLQVDKPPPRSASELRRHV